MSIRLIAVLVLLPACAGAKTPAPTAPAVLKRKLMVAAKKPNIVRPAQTLDAVSGTVRSDKDGAVHIEVRLLDKDGSQVGASQYFTVLTDLRVISGDTLFDSTTAQVSNVVLDKAPDSWGTGTIREQVDAVVKALVDTGKVK